MPARLRVRGTPSSRRAGGQSSRRRTVAAIATAATVALLGATVPAWAAQPEKQPARQSEKAPAVSGLARTPYQGWNTYYGLGSSFTEQTIKDEADALVSRGLKAAGYNYVWLDGGWWSGTRDAAGNMTVSSSQWPGGMKAVADYIHSLGLKAGIYTDTGINGCGGTAQGSYGHYQQDADQFAGWGYDAVKADFCGGEQQGLDPAVAYGQFSDALSHNSSHRPMLFNICNPFVPSTGAAPGRSAYDSYKFGPTTGNSWRTDTDVGFVRNVVFPDVLRNLDDDAKHPEAAGPGHWNDPDYVSPELGMTPDEAQAQFSMWSVVAAPLIIGSDVKSLSASTVSMLTNREVLAVDQDRLGVQGTAISTKGDTQVWTKPLSNGDKAVALFNRGTGPATISTTAAQAGLPHAGDYALRDVWKHTTTETAGVISATVAPHSAVLLRVSRSGGASVSPSTTLTPLDVTPAARAAKPLVLPGSSFLATADFTDNGKRALRDVSLAVEAPAGWNVTAVDRPREAELGTGATVRGTWRITPPPGTVPVTDGLTVSAAYRSGGDGPHHESGTSTVSQSTFVQVPAAPPSGISPLSHHPWLDASSGYLLPRVDHDGAGGGPLVMNGTTYPEGIGVASPSTVDFYVGGNCSQLTGTVGIDDSADFDPSGGTAGFQILGDGVKLYDSGPVTRAATHALSVDLGSAKVISLVVGDGGDGGYNDRTDWGGLRITCGAPAATVPAGPWPHYVAPGNESASATSADDGHPVSDAVDGQVTTLWRSRSTPASDPLPISLTVDLKSARTVTGLTYQPRLDGDSTGTITGYTVEVSGDGTTYRPAAPAGTWPQDALLKSVRIAPVQARYVRLTATSAVNGSASAAEIAVAVHPAG
jgi:alpha-galactosidase